MKSKWIASTVSLGIIGVCCFIAGIAVEKLANEKEVAAEIVASWIEKCSDGSILEIPSEINPSSKSSKSFVIGILDTRKAEGAVTPKQWRDFRLALLTWFGEDCVDCYKVLSAHSSLILLREFIGVMESGEPDALLRRARELPSGDEQFALYRAACLASLNRDPEEALLLLSSMPETIRNRLEIVMGMQIAQKMGPKCLEFFAKSHSATAVVLKGAISSSSRSDPNGTASAMLELDKEVMKSKYPSISINQSLSMMLNFCSPEKGIEYAKAMENTAIRSAAIARNTKRLIVQKPELIQKLIETDVSAIHAVIAAAHEMAYKNPALCAQILNAIPGEQARGSAAERIAKEYAAFGKKSAPQWLDQISDPLTKERASVILKRTAASLEEGKKK